MHTIIWNLNPSWKKLYHIKRDENKAKIETTAEKRAYLKHESRHIFFITTRATKITHIKKLISYFIN